MGDKNLINDIDNSIYRLEYIEKNYDELQKLWDSIKKDDILLLEASEIIKDKFEERNVFASNCIAELILKFPEEVNRGVYEEVVNKIYDNDDLAQIVVGGYHSITKDGYNSFGSYSNNNLPFLLYTLTNKKLKLSDNQKNKVYNLALDQYFTERTKEFGGIYYLSAKNGCGIFPYDIRYWVLKNNNWSEEEKEQIIYQFYSKEELYVKLLDSIEFNIQEMYNLEGIIIPKDEISYMKDHEIEELISDEEVKKEITDETHFVKSLKRLRRPKLLLESL